MAAKRVRMIYVHNHECTHQGRKVVREYIAISGDIELQRPVCVAEGPGFLTELERLSVEVSDV